MEASLAASPIKELRRRAKEVGVDAHAVEEAIDEADDPKRAIVQLIVSAQRKSQRLVLVGLNIGRLKKVAESNGVDMGLIHQAIDEADDPKAAVIEIICATPSNTKPDPEPEPLSQSPALESRPMAPNEAAVVHDEAGNVLADPNAFLKYAKLDGHGYLGLLLAHGLDLVEDVVQSVNDADLKSMGMEKEFHRRRFTRCARRCTITAGGKSMVSEAVPPVSQRAEPVPEIDVEELQTKVVKLMSAIGCSELDAMQMLDAAAQNFARALMIKPLMEVTGLSVEGARVYLERAQWNLTDANHALARDVRQIVGVVPHCSETQACGMLEHAGGDVGQAIELAHGGLAAGQPRDSVDDEERIAAELFEAVHKVRIGVSELTSGMSDCTDQAAEQALRLACGDIHAAVQSLVHRDIPPAHVTLAVATEDPQLAASMENFNTCLDREFVQFEINEATKWDKEIITVFEDDSRRQGYFNVQKAWAKYADEWQPSDFAFLLEIDMVTYRRDAREAEAMVQRIEDKMTAKGTVVAAERPINKPGRWDFFLSHAQAASGDQVHVLCLKLRARGYSVWFDQEMKSRSKAAMAEGVKHSDHFLLFLSGDGTASPKLNKRLRAKRDEDRLAPSPSVDELSRLAPSASDELSREPDSATTRANLRPRPSSAPAAQVVVWPEPEPEGEGGAELELNAGVGRGVGPGTSDGAGQMMSTSPREDSSPEPEAADFTEIDDWLTSIKLQRYAPALKGEGYDDLSFVKEAHLEDIEELIATIGMKRPHARVFKTAWAELMGVPSGDSFAKALNRLGAFAAEHLRSNSIYQPFFNDEGVESSSKSKKSVTNVEINQMQQELELAQLELYMQMLNGAGTRAPTSLPTPTPGSRTPAPLLPDRSAENDDSSQPARADGASSTRSPAAVSDDGILTSDDLDHLYD